MIHLTRDDIIYLHSSCHMPNCEGCDKRGCNNCEVCGVCETLRLVNKRHYRNAKIAAKALYDSCVTYSEYTDKVCDTYSCVTCPNYSWCTILRGIAIEGVKLDEY